MFDKCPNCGFYDRPPGPGIEIKGVELVHDFVWEEDDDDNQ